MNPQSPNTHSIARAFLASFVVLAGVFAALAFAGPAAASACGDKVLADWHDNGRVDHLYPPHCYEDAIDAIPDDIRDYADADEVITRALQSSLRGELADGGCDPSADGSANDCKNGSGTPGNTGNGGNGGNGGNSGTGGPGDDPETAPEIDTSGPSSVPIPLIVLGGMSLALLAAGGLGYISRRRQAALADDFGDDDTLV